MRYRIAGFLVAALLFDAVGANAQAQGESPPPAVSASAFVDVFVRPVAAVVTVTLTGEGQNPAAAATAVDSLHARLVAAIRAHSLELVPWGDAQGENQAVRRMIPGQADVHTSRDYVARRAYLIFMNDVSGTAVVLRDVAAAGVPSGLTVSYNPDQADPKLAAAAAEATRIATQRARATAEAAGGTLGPLRALQTLTVLGQQNLLRLNYSDPSGVQLIPSEVIVRVQVSGTWRFEVR